MSSKKEDEKNEKIIRGLMKLPPNRRCINCDSLGPQYICTNFWTFVCTTCSGIHREFTHRVKSVSMAKFTTQEVEALQRGGNQRAREMFLKGWDVQRMRLPDCSNADKIREFIKTVYVEKKYAVGKSDKPPKDIQSLKNQEEYRRASSYHSFSQSPPYEHQYEDRHYGKQTGMLSRKPGSDRGHYEGKISSFIHSPGHSGEHMYEDRFANDSVGSRISDYSVSSTVDPFRPDGQSPNFQNPGYNSPPLQQVRDILIEDAQKTSNTYSEANVKRGFDGIPRPQRTESSGSFGSFDGNSAANPGSLMDIVNASGTQQAETSAFPSSHLSAPGHSTNQDLFSLPTVQQPTTSLSPPIDLFAGINHQDSFIISSEQKTLADPVSENVDWATFDLPHHPGPSETYKVLPPMVPHSEGAPKGNINAITSMPNNSQWYPVQNSASRGPFSSIADQWHAGLHEVKRSSDPKNSQSWNAFDYFTGNVSQDSFSTLPQKSETQVLVLKPPTSGDPYISLKFSEVPVENGYHESALDDSVLGLGLPFDSVAGSLSPPAVFPLTGGTTLERKSTNPFDLPYDLDQEVNNVFLDMSSLQAALPKPQSPNSFLGGLSQSWLPQNSIVPSVPTGELVYIAGQLPSSQLLNIRSHDHVASVGGNPFA